MTADLRALCAELADELDAETGYTRNDGVRITNPVVSEARAALAAEDRRPDPPTYAEWEEKYLRADRWNRTPAEAELLYEGFCSGWYYAPDSIPDMPQA